MNVGFNIGFEVLPTVNTQLAKVLVLAAVSKTSPTTKTAFTCIEDPRSIFQKQFTAGPVENKEFAISPILTVGEETRWTELLSVRFGITFALRLLLVSSNATQLYAQISLINKTPVWPVRSIPTKFPVRGESQT